MKDIVRAAEDHELTKRLESIAHDAKLHVARETLADAEERLGATPFNLAAQIARAVEIRARKRP